MSKSSGNFFSRWPGRPLLTIFALCVLLLVAQTLSGSYSPSFKFFFIALCICLEVCLLLPVAKQKEVSACSFFGKIRRHQQMHPRLSWIAAIAFYALLFIYADQLQERSYSSLFNGEALQVRARVSIVIPVKYEQDYIIQTIMYTMQTTPDHLLEEIIVIDDESKIPVEPLVLKSYMPGGMLEHLTPAQREKVIVVRNEQKQGLIRAKTLGGNMAKGDHIFFLDGHCRPAPEYMERMVARLQQGSYKRIIVPMVDDVDGQTWEFKNSAGAKMMFSWDFDFDWFDDKNDDVPISSGGILLMTTRWWVEGGGYDDGMLDWGGENIEQSMRTWMCGGEIIVERSAVVGHIFHRPSVPDKVGPNQVQINQARAAFAYLDDSYENFANAVPVVRSLQLGPRLLDRIAVRTTLQCNTFEWYVNRFRGVFEMRGMFLDQLHNFRHSASGFCLEATPLKKNSSENPTLSIKPCQSWNELQRWTPSGGDGRRLVNLKHKKCIDRYSITHNSWKNEVPILFECDHREENFNQPFRFSGKLLGNDRKFGRIFTSAEPSFIHAPSGKFAEKEKHPDLLEVDRCFNDPVCLNTKYLCLTSRSNGGEIDRSVPELNRLEDTAVFLAPCLPPTESSWVDTQAWETVW